MLTWHCAGEESAREGAGSFTLLFESSLSQDVTQYSQNPSLSSQFYLGVYF